MTKRAQRTISVAELLILAGTAAIGMGCLLAVDRTLQRNWLTTDWYFLRRQEVGRGAGLWLDAVMIKSTIAYVIPLLGSWSAVLPLLRLRSLGPRPRRSLGQPGIVACLAAWAGAA